jgi:hypothetical protein
MLDAAEEIKDVLCIDLAPITREEYSWETRTHALTEASFDEFLLLDADSFPTISPESLFYCQEHLELGTLYWPSIEKWSPEELQRFEKLVGASIPEARIDQGQILVKRHSESFYMIEKQPVVIDCGLKHFGPDGNLSFIHANKEPKSIPPTKDLEMMMERFELTEEDLQKASCRICTEWEELLYED